MTSPRHLIPLFNGNCGYSLLEFAGILLIVLALLLGSIDLSRIYHTSNVLGEAAERTARELSGVTSTGVSFTPNLGSRTFNWTHYSWNADQTRREARLVAQRVPEDSTPHECESLPEDQDCVKQFAGFETEGGPSSTDLHIDQVSRDFGFREVAAALPQARYDCDPATQDCVTIQVGRLFDGEREQVEVTANYTLGLWALLQADQFVVSRRVIKTIEKSMINRSVRVHVGSEHYDEP